MPIDPDVPLPPDDHRHVIGIWLMTSPAAPCTRSIEEVEGRYYMVVRCTDSPNAEGKVGALLKKLSETEYQGANYSYRILADGRLVAYQDAEIMFEARRYHQLWPEVAANMAVLPDAAASASLHRPSGSPRRKPPRWASRGTAVPADVPNASHLRRNTNDPINHDVQTT
jgi:hypothetical protein